MPERGDVIRSHDGCVVHAAAKNNLDDITQIHIAGFTEEPDVHYRYPLRHQYPEDHWKWTRKEYESYLEQPQKFVLHVVEAPSEADGRVFMKPFGLAVWDIAVTSKANATDVGLEERRDANKKHCKAFREASGKRWDRYFSKYGEDQIYLSILVVHPEFRRRGAGTMLVNWGIKVAEEKAVPVTLCGSPMGQLLYEHLKFKKIASEVVQADGEDETMTSAVMVLEKTD